MKSVEVAIVGGSLGGLTAACLLRDRGHDVTIYERSAAELEQRGAGIGLLEATYRYLVDHGGVDLGDISVETSAIRYLERDGSVGHEADHTYLFSSWNTVYRQLLDHWGADRYLLDHELVTFDDVSDPERVGLTFGNGSKRSCDLLVCADGVGSACRVRLQPRAEQRYAGYVAWRGMVPEADLPPEVANQLTNAITYFVYANSHILVYPIPGLDGSVAPGDRLINFVWYRNYLEGGELDDLLTDSRGERRDLSLPPGAARAHHVAEVKATAEARLPGVLAQLVSRTAEPFVQVIYDIEVERMAFGRVCLLGDAASVARPHAAAGSAKAAADGWALATAMDAASDVPSALAAWEPGQLALAHQLVERTRSVGRRSQIDNNWKPGDPDLIFGLTAPGQ